MNIKPIDKRAKLNFLERIFIPEMAKGMVLTFKHMFQKKYTQQYPEVKKELRGSFRGSPVLVRDASDGKARCVACGLCARVCPALAIEVQAEETTDLKERTPAKFEINLLRCIYCGYCEEVCPEEAIVLSQQYEWTFPSKEAAVLDREQLLTPEAELAPKLHFLVEYRNV